MIKKKSSKNEARFLVTKLDLTNYDIIIINLDC